MAKEVDLAEAKRRLATLGMRPSASADRARAEQRAEIRALSVEERVELALRLGRRDREARAARTE